MENNTEEFYKLVIDILLKTGLDKKVAAIKELRKQTGLSLVDAKSAIDIVANDFEAYKNLFYPENEETSNVIEDTTDESQKYEDMSLEELKAQIEKEKLIAELKELKKQNNETTTQNISQQSNNNRLNTISSTSNTIKTTKQRKKENKAAGIACCPKCGSTSIQATNKKLSVGRAIIGTAILPGVGTVLGGLSSKKTVCTCLNCGHKWKL